LPLNGKRVLLSENFKTKVGALAGPPAHPRCRCTATAVPEDIVAGLRRASAGKG
jgi:hypothetical protein